MLIILAITTFLESSQVLLLVDDLALMLRRSIIIVKDVVVNARDHFTHQIVLVLNDLSRLHISHLNHSLHLVK